MAARSPLQQVIRRKVAAAKAARGFNWRQISSIMASCGLSVSPSHLMAKMSRGSFRADELVLMMRILGGSAIDLSDLDIPGLDQAMGETECPGTGVRIEIGGGVTRS